MSSVRETPIVAGFCARNQLILEFTIDFEIKNISLFTMHGLKTPEFYPYGDKTVGFYFEIFYTKLKVEDSDHEFSNFVVNLVKSSVPEIDLKNHKMDVDLTVYYSDYSVYESFVTDSSIDVDSQKSLECIRSCRESFANRHSTDHGTQIAKDKISFECRFAFSNHLSTPTQYSNDMFSLQNFQKFSKNLHDFYNDAIMCDVDFKIKDEIIPAHKTFLVSHSPVLKKMFGSNFLESKTNTVTIDDVENDIFKKFLRFLYCGDLDENISWNDLKELYILSDKYDVEVLGEKCIFRMKSSLNKENVVEVFELARNCNDEKIKKMAEEFIPLNLKELITAEEWTVLAVSHPNITKEILSRMYSKCNIQSTTDQKIPSNVSDP